MLDFQCLLSQWGSDNFDVEFKLLANKLTTHELPLQKGLSHSSIALDKNINTIIINTTKEDGYIKVKAGIFYFGVIAGCNCSDDPSPIDMQNEYCEVLFDINSKTGHASVTLV